MDNIEEELQDNDFELEFTDLPVDEKPTISGKLAAQAFYFSNRFDFSATLATLHSRLRLRMRLWRVVLAACTLLLVLLLILGNLPNVRESFSSLLAQPTPIPASTNSGAITSWSSIRVIIEGSPGVMIVGNKPTSQGGEGTVIIIDQGSAWSSDTTPGPAPQGQDCPGRPAIGFSHEVGGPPVLAAGFTGPYATLHLYPAPVSVPAYPARLGWTASILIEIPTNFTSTIVLDNGNLHSGSPILFQTDSSQDPSARLTLDPMELRTNPSNSSTGQSIAWSVTLYFPSAGCYALDASWPGGHWQVNFSAGR